MPECRSVKELNDYIGAYMVRVIQDIADQVRDDVYRDVRDEINDSIRRQSAKSNQFYAYEHTWDVLESICKPQAKYESGRVEVEIYYDTDEINAKYNKESFWNSHMDVNGGTSWGGQSIPELMPIWLELGTEYGLAPREGWGIMEKWHNWVKSALKNRVKAELKTRYGLKVR